MKYDKMKIRLLIFLCKMEGSAVRKRVWKNRE